MYIFYEISVLLVNVSMFKIVAFHDRGACVVLMDR